MHVCAWNGGKYDSLLSWKKFPGQKSLGGNKDLNARSETDSTISWTLILKYFSPIFSDDIMVEEFARQKLGGEGESEDEQEEGGEKS